MPYANDPSVGDFEKLQIALRDLATKFGSVDDLLRAFGLADMPQAQRYGILFGCIVFALTVTAVLVLLFLGGSFQRIAQQAATGDSTLLTASEARQQRSLLLEQLLEGRERMVRNYDNDDDHDPHGPPVVSGKPRLTKLTKMLLNEAPDSPLEVQLELIELDENNDASNNKNKKETKGAAATKKARYIPPFYEENYIEAYRKCQERPGGMYAVCI